MFLAVILIFLALVFLGVMNRVSKAADVGFGFATFYTLGWIGSLVWLCCRWSHLHGFWATLWAMFLAFIAPMVIHVAAIVLKEFVVWALKGLGE